MQCCARERWLTAGSSKGNEMIIRALTVMWTAIVALTLGVIIDLCTVDWVLLRRASAR